jgi:HEAT repeat protein
MNPIRSDSRVGLGEFAALFLRGNPFSAIGSLIGYYRAKDEHDTIVMTERLGRAKSPLTVNELLAALADPRFNVRFEALIAIAHTAPHPRLTEALVQILQGNNPALSAIAAWALGRLGDEQAFTALRQGLSSPYRSIQAHCARSLGAMGDHGSATLLRARLESEQDAGVRVAIASALGLLGVEDASRELLSLLAQSVEENERWELALALARIIDDESQFVQWWRAVHLQDATELAQAVTALKKQLTSAPESVLGERLERCSDALAHNDLAGGADLLRQSLELYQTERPLEMSEMKLSVIARDCGHRLGEFGGARPEYLLLTLYVLRKSKT